MMSNRKVHTIFLFTLILCLTFSPTKAFASGVDVSQPIIQPLMNKIAAASATLGISGNTARIEGYGKSISSKYITIRISLIKSTSAGWSEVVSYSASGNGVVNIAKSFSLSSPGAYRVKMVASCEGETYTTYSTTKYK